VDIWIAQQLAATQGADFCLEQIVAGKDASEFRSAIDAIHERPQMEIVDALP
jgi:hypothetical protein